MAAAIVAVVHGSSYIKPAGAPSWPPAINVPYLVTMVQVWDCVIRAPVVWMVCQHLACWVYTIRTWVNLIGVIVFDIRLVNQVPAWALRTAVCSVRR